jgi:DNA-binding response OmpR family regulator
VIAAHPAATLPWGYRVGAGVKRRPRILLVEDDADMAAMYRLQLERDEFEVAVSGDVAGALAMVRSRPFDALLLDLRLRGGTGFDVLEAVRADDRLAAIPVLVLSNYGDPATVGRALGLGAAGYLVKSVTSPPELAARLRSLLSRD